MKNDNYDIPIGFNDADLMQLFEPFNPDTFEVTDLKPHQRLPIILAHGIARPDFLINSVFQKLNLSFLEFSFLSDRFHYFRGIGSHLQKYGFDVYHTSVSLGAGVSTRARDLKDEILKLMERNKYEKVHIIAHSMGGLDARHMIVYEGMDKYVRALSTVGTPHWGTSAADAALSQGVESVLGLLNSIIDLEGIRSCTTGECQNFNREAEDAEAKNKVIYQAYGSRQSLEETFYPFKKTWDIIARNEGESDGLIPLSSALWTQELVSKNGRRKKRVIRYRIPFPADHLDQMGWCNMNNLHKTVWWNARASRMKATYETLIKNIYLKIAVDVQKMCN